MSSNTWFWINSVTLPISTHSLFSFVRSLPEPIPIDIIRWDSITSHLAYTGTQWSALLQKELYVLQFQMAKNWEAIVYDSLVDETIPLIARFFELDKIFKDLTLIIEAIDIHPLSSWATCEEDLKDAKIWFSFNEESVCKELFNLPHLYPLTNFNSFRMACAKRDARREIARFNKNLKLAKSGKLPDR